LYGELRYFDGTGWDTIRDPVANGHARVWASGPSDVYELGPYLLTHFDGSTWADVTLPSSAAKHGIWGSGSDDVFVAAANGVVFHFNGTSWTETVTPYGGDLMDIWGLAPNDVYAAGEEDDGVVLHYAGTWSEVAVGAVDQLSLAGNADAGQIVAVTKYGSVYIPDTVGWTLDWEGVPCSSVKDLWGFASDEVYGACAGGAVINYDGTQWTVMTRLDPDGGSAIWGTSPDDLYVAGAGGAVFHYDGSGWMSQDTGTTHFIYNIFGTGPDDVYALDYYGHLQRFDGASWVSDASTRFWESGK
jgi:hypothetical protein